MCFVLVLFLMQSHLCDNVAHSDGAVVLECCMYVVVTIVTVKDLWSHYLIRFDIVGHKAQG
jgi:hypothetical protein